MDCAILYRALWSVKIIRSAGMQYTSMVQVVSDSIHISSADRVSIHSIRLRTVPIVRILNVSEATALRENGLVRTNPVAGVVGFKACNKAADCTCYCQQPHGKDHGDLKPFPSSHLHGPDDALGKHQDRDIEEGVEKGRG